MVISSITIKLKDILRKCGFEEIAMIGKKNEHIKHYTISQKRNLTTIS